MITILNRGKIKCTETNIGVLTWSQYILITLTLFFSVFLLLIPLCLIFLLAFSEGYKTVIINILNIDTLNAIYLTILVTLLSVFINIFFGMFVAWVMVRFNFFGKQLLFILLNIPVAISPVVAGLLYLLCYARTNSIIGYWLDLYDFQIIFTWLGIVLVTIFVTSPLIANELIPLMISQGSEEDEAAILLGASGWKMFRFVTFPNIRWALLYGVIITNARAVGEFGAVSIVSGLIRGETYTLSLYIELLYQDYNIVGAFTVSSLLALFSICILFIKNYLQYRLKYDN